jgi:GH24 family phage-related lysozyme (muramidase)
MKLSLNGVNLIEQSEGLRLSVYLDNGKPCIGYGHDLLPGESFPNGIDQSEALSLLEKDVAPLLNVIERECPQANQNQIDSLCDFGYNLGIGDLETMLGHGFDQVPFQMPRWDYNKGVPDPKILARREREVSLFNTPC